MNILLIAPATGKWKSIGRHKLFNGKTFRFSLLSLLSLAAETPQGVQIKIIDEQIEDIPWDEEYDLVGITCMTAAAPRAYEISERFQREGIPVVLGGMHPTLCPDEAIQHANAIVVGEAEGVWRQVIGDARHKRLGGIYRHDGQLVLQGLKPPPRHLLEKDKYATIHAVQATRGCPNQCDFCAVSAFHQATHRRRPVEEVVQEVSNIQGRFFIFVDDNLTADDDYARRLFEALIPLKKKWVTQATLSIAEDPEFVKLAAEAGCIGLFVGLETFLGKNLDAVQKGFNRVEKYREAVQLFHSHGIGVEAGVVFGFDHDDPGIFEKTIKLLDRLEIDMIQVSIFTPLPGTRRFTSMQDRIFNHNWVDYDFHHAVYQPRRMSAQQLQAGHDWVTRQFYRPHKIIQRLWRQVFRPNGIRTLPYAIGINLAYYGRVLHWHIRGSNPTKNKPFAFKMEPKGYIEDSLV